MPPESNLHFIIPFTESQPEAVSMFGYLSTYIHSEIINGLCALYYLFMYTLRPLKAYLLTYLQEAHCCFSVALVGYGHDESLYKHKRLFYYEESSKQTVLYKY